MEIHQHPTGRIVTLDPHERFVVRGADGQRLKVRVVTTLTDERGPYWSAGGADLMTRRYEVLPDEFRDFGLLPPHVRDAIAAPAPLDFGTAVSDTEIGRAQAVQHGLLPTGTPLAQSVQGVTRGRHSLGDRVTGLRVTGLRVVR